MTGRAAVSVWLRSLGGVRTGTVSSSCLWSAILRTVAVASLADEGASGVVGTATSP